MAPAFVVGASVTARRFGPLVGGLVAGLPVVGGPILLVLAVVHGAGFAGRAASASLLGLISLALFVMAYASVVRRVAWPAAVGDRLERVRPRHRRLGADHRRHPHPADGRPRAGVLVVLGRQGGPAAPAADAPPAPRDPPSWDLPVRAACAAAMVLALSAASSGLGAAHLRPARTRADHHHHPGRLHPGPARPRRDPPPPPRHDDRLLHLRHLLLDPRDLAVTTARIVVASVLAERRCASLAPTVRSGRRGGRRGRIWPVSALVWAETHGETFHHPRLFSVRPHRAAVDGPVPGLRGVEHAGRGARAGGSARAGGGAAAGRGGVAAPQPVALRDVTASAVARLSHRASASWTASWAAAWCPGSLVLLGGSPGIGKSTLTGMAMGNLVGAAAPDALRLRRGVRGADPPARTSGWRRRLPRARRPGDRRDRPRRRPGHDRAAPARGLRDRLGPDAPRAGPHRRARLGRPGARGRVAADAHGEVGRARR